MAYRVEELAASGGVSVDTIRYYQSLGLLDPPRREGRVAFYTDRHLVRLGRIRELAESGFTLRQIGELVDGSNGDVDPLLAALASQAPSGARMSRKELAERSGVDDDMLRIGIEAGLLQPRIVDGAERFDDEQAGMVSTVGRLLRSGVDLGRLVALATTHAANIESLVTEAVALYREAVEAQPELDRDRIADEIRALVPAVTRLVADHFNRTLVSRAAELVDDLDDRAGA